MSLPISEHPRRSPTRTLSFYLVLVLCVLPVWSIPICSWLFVLYELSGGGIWGLSWHGKALFTYALTEARRSPTKSLRLCQIQPPCSRSCSQYTTTSSTSSSMVLARLLQEMQRSVPWPSNVLPRAVSPIYSRVLITKIPLMYPILNVSPRQPRS